MSLHLLHCFNLFRIALLWILEIFSCSSQGKCRETKDAFTLDLNPQLPRSTAELTITPDLVLTSLPFRAVQAYKFDPQDHRSVKNHLTNAAYIYTQ